MRDICLIFVLSFALCQTINNPFQNVFPNTGSSQTSTVGLGWSDEAKAIFYQTERISPEKALTYQLSMPFPFINLGYAYSDNWRRGLQMDLLIAGLILVGSVSVSGGGDSDCNDYCSEWDDYGNCDHWEYDCDYNSGGGSGLTVAAFVGAMGLSVYKFVDVYMAAEEFNDNLYRRVFGGQRPYFSLGYALKNKGALLTLNVPLK